MFLIFFAFQCLIVCLCLLLFKYSFTRILVWPIPNDLGEYFSDYCPLLVQQIFIAHHNPAYFQKNMFHVHLVKLLLKISTDKRILWAVFNTAGINLKTNWDLPDVGWTVLGVYFAKPILRERTLKSKTLSTAKSLVDVLSLE